MSKNFNGRVVTRGNLSGDAVVFLKKTNFTKILDDPTSQNEITGKVLCIPGAVESVFGGLYLLTACKNGFAPSAILFSDSIDQETASGILLASNWLGKTITCVDQLGQPFLESVKTGSKIDIKDTGEVIIT